MHDPAAPISAVAGRAGVGISALYRRYAGKEDLLRQLCLSGLRRFLLEAEAAADEPDGWVALVGFLERVVDADVHSLTARLAGTFEPTAELLEAAARADELAAALVRRAHESGRLRAGIVAEDLALVLEGCAAIRVDDGFRTVQLRRRQLALLIRGLSAPGAARPAVGSSVSQKEGESLVWSEGAESSVRPEGAESSAPAEAADLTRPSTGSLPGPPPQPGEFNRWRR